MEGTWSWILPTVFLCVVYVCLGGRAAFLGSHWVKPEPELETASSEPGYIPGPGPASLWTKTTGRWKFGERLARPLRNSDPGQSQWLEGSGLDQGHWMLFPEQAMEWPMPALLSRHILP